MADQIKFFTPVQIPAQKHKISCNSRILTLGSCFSEHIGNQLSSHFFTTLINPFGTIFNPVSIANVIDLSINGKKVAMEDLNVIGSRYFHYDFHSSFDAIDPSVVKSSINLALEKVESFVKETDFLMLTFGTSIIYRLKENDQLVSNCHKVPNHRFQKEMLPFDFMIEKLQAMISKLKNINPSLKIILTVSPVRHTKDGLVENSLSKSQLINVCHQLASDQDSIFYFPAYEIMVDELRDYRFYEADLIHPNSQAVDIIWDRFMSTFFDSQAIQKVKDISALNAARNHLPFDPSSMEHQKFRKSQMGKIQMMKNTYPEVDFSEMIQFFTTG